MNETMALPPLPYSTVVKFAEQFAAASGIRNVENIEPSIRALGGSIKKVNLQEWTNDDLIVYECSGDQTGFEVTIPSFSPQLDKFLLCNALGHWILHSSEGKRVVSVHKGESSSWAQEALWFSLCLLIPDNLYITAKEQAGADPAILAHLFKVPSSLLNIKQRILEKQGFFSPSALT